MSVTPEAAKGPTMKLMKKPASTAGEVVETVEAVKTTTKPKVPDQPDGETLTKPPEDLIKNTVHEIENLKEDKAFALVPKLLDNIDQDYFRLGGVLAIIQNEGWFMDKAYENFKAYVEAELPTLGYRKVMYLIQIYNGLVASGVQWEQVKHLGWTKLKELSPILSQENVDEWVALAETLTVLQLQDHIKAATAAPSSDGKTTDDADAKKVTTMTFKVHTDQKEIVREALDKAKHDIGTEFDTVALESICINFLGGESKLKAIPTLAELMTGKSAEEVLGVFGDIFPDVILEATLPE